MWSGGGEGGVLIHTPPGVQFVEIACCAVFIKLSTHVLGFLGKRRVSLESLSNLSSLARVLLESKYYCREQ
jgi:hypothetical protein